MARTTKKGSPARAGKGKPAKSLPKKKTRVARKAARKPVKAPAKGKARPKPSARKPAKAQAKPVHDAAHERHMQDVRRQVARRRPGMAPMITHGQEQQDASIVPPPPPPPAPPVDTLHQNWGDAKERAVTRNDKPTNWFRQAPKPKSK